MVWLLRLLLVFLFIFVIFRLIKFLLKPTRKLEAARKHKRFLLLDNEEVIKNFQLTYNGVLFTGEKYLGATKNTIDVVSISLWPDQTSSLHGMTKEDFYFIEEKIHERYPVAQINWKSPIHEFLQQK
ncbi:sigma-w pathway protein ysdB [Neobacillus sp. DY30]|uniref:sigma-w pathway protein ysdB n=1 Tax=Neobacillus sp. DY30 TaxID=3047871 RepID=UPI0024BF3EE7|nr:sigma-w pathway protein ysdB [Neobacillus sp. DY30]WHX99562.1 sigma-w pathway protein ysdB [Neobacillus sp. DY30]